MSIDKRAVRVIESARNVIDFGFWVRGANAESESGYGVSPLDPSAVGFDIEGACFAAADALGYNDRTAFAATKYLDDKLGDIIEFNDNAKSKVAVVRALDQILQEAA